MEDISVATVQPIATQEYTGEALTPEPVLKYNGKTLEKGQDYELSYTNNTIPGTATITITGKKFFSGTRIESFTIGKRALNVTAENHSINTGEPTTNLFTATADRLVAGDKLTSCQYSCSYAAGTSPQGTYPITPSAAVISGAHADYYEIKYVPGTLTVTDILVSDIKLPGSLLISIGEEQTISPTITPANATHQSLTWSSSDTSVATVDQQGKVKALRSGTTEIKAKSKDSGAKESNVCVVTVKYKITYQLNGGTNYSNNPTSYYDESIALRTPTKEGYVFRGWYLDSAFKNRIYSISPQISGDITLYAKWQEEVAGEVFVDHTEVTLQKNSTFQLTGITNPVGKQIIWTSLNNEIASVDATGLVTANGYGTTRIIAKSGTGQAACTVTVSLDAPEEVKAFEVTPNNTAISKGNDLQLSATLDKKEVAADQLAYAFYTNATKNTSLAITEENGIITVKGTDGKAIMSLYNGTVSAIGLSSTKTVFISITYQEAEAACEITINVPAQSVQISGAAEYAITVGNTLPLSATVLPDNCDDSTLQWSSQNEEIAAVNESGTVTAVNVGRTQITVATAEGKTDTVDIIVNKKIDIIDNILLGYGDVADRPTGTLYVNGTEHSGDTYAKVVQMQTKTNKNGSVSAYTGNVEYTSTNPEAATVDSNGLVTAVGEGYTVITATDGEAVEGQGVFDICTITVKTKLEQIQTNILTYDEDKAPANEGLYLKKGTSFTVTATAVPANATDKALIWSSNDTTVATVTAKGVIKAVNIGSTKITVKNASGEVVRELPVYVSAAAVSGAVKLFAEGESGSQATEIVLMAGFSGIEGVEDFAAKTNQLQGVAYTDNTCSEVAYTGFTYKSSNAKVVTVSDSGLLTAVGKGTATITVTTTDGSKKSATRKVLVTQPAGKITFNKDILYLLPGKTGSVKATVLPATASNSSVSWQVTDTEKFSITDKGVVTAKANTVEGDSTTVTATAAGGVGVSATYEVKVIATAVTKLSLNKSTLTLSGAGTTEQLTATVSPATATIMSGDLVWSSNNDSVAAVSSSGLITVTGYGKATITAATADGTKKATCAVTTYPIDKALKLAAKDSVRSIQMYENNVRTSTTLEILDSKGAQVDNNLFTFSSSNMDVAVVNEQGVVTSNPAFQGSEDGTTVITAVLKDDLSKRKVTFTVNVKKLLINQSAVTLYVNGDDSTNNKMTMSLSAAARNVVPVWSSSNPAVATVSVDGTVVAHAVGTAVITATDSNGSSKYANCIVTVRKQVEDIEGVSALTMQKGKGYALTWVVTPDDASDKTLLYSSSDTTVATVDKKGKISAKAVGNTQIYVTNTESGITKKILLTVVDTAVNTVTITGNDTAAMNPQDEILLEAAAYAKTGEQLSDREFVWTSSNVKVATVDANGNVKAVAKGSATITALSADGSGKKATRAVKVLGPVEDIQLKKDIVYLQANKSEALAAIITPTNADIKTIDWSISNTTDFSISTKGVVKVNANVAAGTTATVTATSHSNPGVSDTCEVKVIGVPVSGVTLNATKMDLVGIGTTCPMSATLKPANCDLSVADLVWTSSDDTIATVDSNGLITTAAYGKATITACTPDGVRKAACAVTVYPIDKTYKLSALTATQNLEIYARNTKSQCKVQIKEQFGNLLDADLFTYSSNNTSMVLVNEEGLVTVNPTWEKDGKAVVTATLKGDPSKRAVKFTINVLKTAQVEELVLLVQMGDSTYSKVEELTLEFRKGAVLTFKAQTYNSKGESMPAKVKWTLSDASLGKLVTNKDGTVSVTLNKEGRFTLGCQAQDKYQRTDSVAITTLTGTPQLVGNSITINKYAADSTNALSSAFTLRAVNASEIITSECAVVEVKNGRNILSQSDLSKFAIVKNADGTYSIQVNSAYLSTMANASYAVKVDVVTDAIDLLRESAATRHTTTFNLTLKVVNTAPSVKLATPSINLFYTDAESRKQKLEMTVPAQVESVSIPANQTNGFDDYFTISKNADGNYYIAFTGDTSVYKKTSLAGKVIVKLSGYSPVTASITVKTPTTAPALKQAVTPQMDVTFGDTAKTAIINNATRETFVEYDIVSQNNAALNVTKNVDGTLKISAVDGYQYKNNAILSTTLKLESSVDNWSKDLDLKISVKVFTTTKPPVAFGTSTFTLNKQAAKECASVTLKSGRDNLKIESSDAWTIKKYDSVSRTYVNCEDFVFDYHRATGMVDVSFADGKNVPTGTYKMRISGMINNYEDIAKDISIKVTDTAVSATVAVKGTIDLINRGQKYLTATANIKNTAGTLSAVVFTGENADYYYPVLTGDKTFTIRLKQGAVVQAGKVVIPVKLTLDGGTIINSSVAFTATQSTPAVKAPAAQTIFKSGEAKQVDYNLQTGVTAGVTINKITAISVPAGFSVTTNGARVVVHLTNANMKPGTYKIKVNSSFVGAQSIVGYPDGKPVTTTITVKVAE